MPRSTETPTCDAVLEGLEAYLDHLDGAEEAAAQGLPPEPREHLAGIATHLETCPACSRELALAARIRTELRSLPQPEPGEIGLPEKASPVEEAAPWWLRPAPLAALGGFAAAVMVAVALTLMLAPPPAAPPPTAAEVARAEAEARYAFARVAEVSERARRELRDDILTRRVVVPATTAIVHSLDRRRDPPSRRPAP